MTLTLESPASTATLTTAEYFYDYAGQDPINGYDLDGTMMLRGNDGDCGGCDIVVTGADGRTVTLGTEGVVDACDTKCVVIGVTLTVTGVKGPKLAAELGRAAESYVPGLLDRLRIAVVAARATPPQTPTSVSLGFGVLTAFGKDAAFWAVGKPLAEWRAQEMGALLRWAANQSARASRSG